MIPNWNANLHSVQTAVGARSARAERSGKMHEAVEEEAMISNFQLFNKTRRLEQWWAEEIKDHLEQETLAVENLASPVLIDSLEAVP